MLVRIALVLTGTAAFFAVLAWLILSKTPAVETAPTVADAAVETPVEAGAAAVVPPASGAPDVEQISDDLDRHIEEAIAVANDTDVPPPPIVAWCAPCATAIGFHNLGEVLHHIRTHTDVYAQDFVRWEQEVRQS